MLVLKAAATAYRPGGWRRVPLRPVVSNAQCNALFQPQQQLTPIGPHAFRPGPPGLPAVRWLQPGSALQPLGLPLQPSFAVNDEKMQSGGVDFASRPPSGRWMRPLRPCTSQEPGFATPIQTGQADRQVLSVTATPLTLQSHQVATAPVQPQLEAAAPTHIILRNPVLVRNVSSGSPDEVILVQLIG